MTSPTPRPATLHDVAREAGVAVSTVSRALTQPDRISPATRARVQEVARRLGVELVGIGMPAHFLVGDPDDGDWFVDTRCIDCGTCRDVAPRLFGAVDDFSVVVAQPDASSRLDAWLAAHDAPVGRYRDLVHDVERAEAADLAALAVVRRALRDLAALD